MNETTYQFYEFPGSNISNWHFFGWIVTATWVRYLGTCFVKRGRKRRRTSTKRIKTILGPWYIFTNNLRLCCDLKPPSLDKSRCQRVSWLPRVCPGARVRAGDFLNTRCLTFNGCCGAKNGEHRTQKKQKKTAWFHVIIKNNYTFKPANMSGRRWISLTLRINNLLRWLEHVRTITSFPIRLCLFSSSGMNQGTHLAGPNGIETTLEVPTLYKAYIRPM